MQFSAMETLMIALLVLGTGQWLVHRISILSRLNMPEPVVGGLLATIIVTGLQIGGVSLTFDESMKVPSMLFFFGAVGLAADFRLLKQGGWAMLLFAVLVIVLVALQDLAGVGMAKLMGLEPYYGLIGGSVTMTGGHGTGGGLGQCIREGFWAHRCVRTGSGIRHVWPGVWCPAGWPVGHVPDSPLSHCRTGPRGRRR